MRAFRLSLAGPAILGLGALACAGAGGTGEPIPVDAYNGAWRLDASEVTQREDEARERVGGGDRRVRMDEPLRSPTGAELEAMRVAVPNARQLTLEVSDSVVTLDEGTRTLMVPLGGEVQDTWQGVDVEIAASWRGGALYVERRFTGGVRVREEFRAADGRLTVEMSVSAPSFAQPRRVRRVYDRVSGG